MFRTAPANFWYPYYMIKATIESKIKELDK